TLRIPRNDVSYEVIRRVVYEEMLHLALACNLLNAVDGDPALAHPDFIPHYPAKLPEADGDFKVQLMRCCDMALATFMKIELPSFPLPPVPEAFRDVGYRTI